MIQTAAYFTKKDNRRGEYKATELDKAKAEADVLLESIDGNYYTLWLNNEAITVKGRGVKESDGRRVVVTEKVYDRLKEQYRVMCDF